MALIKKKPGMDVKEITEIHQIGEESKEKKEEARANLAEKSADFPKKPNNMSNKDLISAFRDSGKAAVEAMTQEEKDKLRSKQGTISFEYCLFHPKIQMTRTIAKNKQINSSNSESYFKPVGYAFTALEEVKIPVWDLNCPMKHELDATYKGERVVAKGQKFYLNHAELGDFISRVEYCGAFTGGDLAVTSEDKFCKVRKDEDGNQIPMTVLRLRNGSSIKNHYVMIATVQKNGDGSLSYPINPEFERFAVYSQMKGGSISRSNSKNAEQQKLIEAKSRNKFWEEQRAKQKKREEQERKDKQQG
ncbi:MAG: hypothetical protein LBM93_10155 [Oscillospiraceae bacterium]|jgi:hypothetical protein|nr:hypothetical protein [Oscillospiraceae bacterium]